MIVAKMLQQGRKRVSSLLSLVVILKYPPSCPYLYLVFHAFVKLDVCILTFVSIFLLFLHALPHSVYSNY